MTNTEIFTRDRSRWLRLLTNVGVACATIVACLTGDAHWACFAQENEVRANWKTGVELHRQLQSLVGVRWGVSNTLRRATGNLSVYQGVSIFLDRRVDPNQEIEFSVQNTELWTLLQQLAKHVQQDVCRIGPTIYIGPPQMAYVLATIVASREDEVSQLPAGVSRRLQRTRRLEWPELTQPRELIHQVGESYGVQIEGMEQMPHDLWPAVDLPSLTFSQQMTLILAGFDLTFSLESAGTKVRLVRLPEMVSLRREYRLPSNAARMAEEIRRRFPSTRVTVNPGGLLVDARIEEHDLIRQLVSGRPEPVTKPKPSPHGDVVYKLAIENQPIGGVAAALAKNLGREIRFDPGVSDRLNDLVSFQVQDATLDELLRAFLDPAELSYQIDDKTLLILPQRPD